LVLFAALAGAGASSAAVAPAVSFRSATYRISIAASYSGQGPTKISCLRDAPQPDGSTVPESYTVNGSASESVSVHTIKAASMDVFIGGGGLGRYFQSGSQKAGRVMVNVQRANVAPSVPCRRDPQGPPVNAPGCGSRSLALHAEPSTNTRGKGLAGKVTVALFLDTPKTLQAPDDPFQSASDQFPQCLMPDGQHFFLHDPSFPSDNCGTVTATKNPTARRFFSGSKRMVLDKTVSGHGFMTDDRGGFLGQTRTFCGTSSTFELKWKLTLIRTSRR
jgi:hypothetical protein